MKTKDTDSGSKVFKILVAPRSCGSSTTSKAFAKEGKWMDSLNYLADQGAALDRLHHQESP